MIQRRMACRHPQNLAFMPTPDRCEICYREKMERFNGAIFKIKNRIGNIGDQAPEELLRGIIRIAVDALNGH
jgi:hypothetical protein